MNPQLLVAVFLGGGLGSTMRFLLSVWLNPNDFNRIPWGTLAANILGCVVIGAVFGLSKSVTLSDSTRAFFIAGVLGGFTTFSAFSWETIRLAENRGIGTAAVYVALSVGIGLIGSYIGYAAFPPRAVVD